MGTVSDILMTLALGGLAVSGLLFASALLYPYLRSAWRQATILARAVFCGAVVVACLFGGAKGKISYPKTDKDVAYLVDAGSYVTNDAVHVAFTRVPTVPDTATFYLDYCAIDATNAQGVATNWVNAKTATFADLTVPFDFAFAAATNYNWMAYTDWTPGPAVQTNGVWHAYWGVDKKQGRYFIPVRTCVRDGSEVIATPKSKWDYEANDEAYWFKHYAPNTALRIDLNYNDAGDNSFGLVIWPTTAETVVTVDWGDGTTTVTNSGSTADYLLEHTYASRKEYVVVIGDTLARPIHFYRAWYVYRKRWPWAVKNFMRWGDSAKNLYESLLYCQNCVGMTPRWPEGAEEVSQVYCDTKMTGPAWPWPKNHGAWDREVYAGCRTLTGTIPEWDDGWLSANSTYYGCTGLTGTIPKWGKNQNNASSTYYGCTGLTGTIPKWGEKMTSVKSVYRGCTGLTGAWTTDPDELMPTNMQHDAYVVADASPELRALFYEDWGGTKKRPTTDE